MTSKIVSNRRMSSSFGPVLRLAFVMLRLRGSRAEISALAFPCGGSLPVACPDLPGEFICAATLWECPVSRICKSPYNFQCRDGTCALNLESCPALVHCPPDHKLCEDRMTCARKQSECAVYNPCPVSSPMRCPWTAECVLDTQLECADLSRVCKLPGQKRCVGNICQSVDANCPLHSSVNITIPDSTVDTDSKNHRIECHDGSRVTAPHECPPLLPDSDKIRCPDSKPIACEGTRACVALLSECPEIKRCPANHILCASGTCVPDSDGPKGCIQHAPLLHPEGTLNKLNEACVSESDGLDFHRENGGSFQERTNRISWIVHLGEMFQFFLGFVSEVAQSIVKAFVHFPIATVDADPSFSPSTPLAIVVEGIDKACTITWEREDGIGVRLAQSFVAGKQIRLLRFAPNTTYKFTVRDDRNQQIGSRPYYYCKSGTTGVPINDRSEPIAHITGNVSFDLLVVDQGHSLIGIDSAGWIVWYLPNSGHAWDQLPDNNLVMQTRKGFSEVTPYGDTVRNLDVAGLSHEAYVDHLSEGSPVLSLQDAEKEYLPLSYKQVANKLVQWHRLNNTMEVLYDLFDFYDPVNDFGNCSRSMSHCSRYPPACLPPQVQPLSWSKGGDDWSHANAAARGTHNNFIMSARHLSSIISFHENKSGIQWVLSGEDVRPSKAPETMVLQYASEDQRHYLQHDVRQLPNGHITLFDNGNLRDPPFSRFSEYRINVSLGVAELVWSFVPMLDNSTSEMPMYAFHGGSVHRMVNGNTVGTLPCDNDRVGFGCSHMVFEVDANGRELARVFIHGSAAVNAQGMGGYRGISVNALAGEFVVDRSLQ